MFTWGFKPASPTAHLSYQPENRVLSPGPAHIARLGKSKWGTGASDRTSSVWRHQSWFSSEKCELIKVDNTASPQALRLPRWRVVQNQNPPASAGRRKRCRFNPWVEKIPWRRHGNPLQYSCLENPMDRGAWWAVVPGVAQSRTRLKQLSTHARTTSNAGVWFRLSWEEFTARPCLLHGCTRPPHTHTQAGGSFSYIYADRSNDTLYNSSRAGRLAIHLSCLSAVQSGWATFPGWTPFVHLQSRVGNGNRLYQKSRK